jgi:hypothetical protein
VTQPMKPYTQPRVPSPDSVNPIRWSDGKLPPSADLTEALARGREPRKMWPVLHAVEGTAERPPGWWESWPALWMFMTVLVLIAGAMLAKC